MGLIHVNSSKKVQQASANPLEMGASLRERVKYQIGDKITIGWSKSSQSTHSPRLISICSYSMGFTVLILISGTLENQESNCVNPQHVAISIEPTFDFVVLMVRLDLIAFVMLCLDS
jgi:hypothetical protein